MDVPEPYYLLYYSLLILGGFLAFLCYRGGDKKSLYIILLLAGTFIVENVRLVLIKEKLPSAYIVNLFSGIEFCLLAVYNLRANTNRRTHIWIKGSMAVFLIFSLISAFMVYRSGAKYYSLITWNINIEGILLFLIYTHLLFNIDADIPIPIFRHAEFWVAIGILLFYGGVFVVLGLYPVLIKIDAVTAGFNYANIIRPLNIILYLCIIGGSICFLINRKYLILLN
jgi:hypothetical protein